MKRDSFYCKDKLFVWLWSFQKNYLSKLEESKLTDMQKQIFLFDWKDSRSKLSPDIEGSVLSSYCFADSVLNYTKELTGRNVNAEMQMKKFEDLAGLNL